MENLEPEAKAKRRIDTFVYGAVALGMIGINVKPWFEAQSEISIYKAKADAEVYVINAKLKAEQSRKQLPKPIQDRLNLLESQVKALTLDNKALKKDSHKPQ